MWGRDNWEWWEWLSMTVGMVAFWALVVWAVVMLVKRNDRPHSEPRDAAAVLDSRFARGEIDEDEYRARRAALVDVGRDPSTDRG